MITVTIVIVMKMMMRMMKSDIKATFSFIIAVVVRR